MVSNVWNVVLNNIDKDVSVSLGTFKDRNEAIEAVVNYVGSFYRDDSYASDGSNDTSDQEVEDDSPSNYRENDIKDAIINELCFYVNGYKYYAYLRSELSSAPIDLKEIKQI